MANDAHFCADSALRRFGNFAKWLFAGCRVICDHNRGVAYVIPLAGAAEWRHKDDGTVCGSTMQIDRSVSDSPQPPEGEPIWPPASSESGRKPTTPKGVSE